MEVVISNERKISEVQKEFSMEFPLLKIDFFETLRAVPNPSPKQKMIAPDFTFEQIRDSSLAATMHIGPEITVQQLESELWDKFGLSAKVFRLSGRFWVDTELTSGWTLDKQNRLGVTAAERYRNPYKEEEDSSMTGHLD